MQAGERGIREAAFYDRLRKELEADPKSCLSAGVVLVPLSHPLLWTDSHVGTQETPVLSCRYPAQSAWQQWSSR